MRRASDPAGGSSRAVARGERHGRDRRGGAGDGAGHLAGELLRGAQAPAPPTRRHRAPPAAPGAAGIGGIGGRADAAAAAGGTGDVGTAAGPSPDARAAAPRRTPPGRGAAVGGRRGDGGVGLRRPAVVGQGRAVPSRRPGPRSGVRRGPPRSRRRPSGGAEADHRRPDGQQQRREHGHARPVAEGRADAVAGDDHDDPQREPRRARARGRAAAASPTARRAGAARPC